MYISAQAVKYRLQNPVCHSHTQLLYCVFVTWFDLFAFYFRSINRLYLDVDPLDSRHCYRQILVLSKTSKTRLIRVTSAQLRRSNETGERLNIGTGRDGCGSARVCLIRTSERFPVVWLPCSERRVAMRVSEPLSCQLIAEFPEKLCSFRQLFYHNSTGMTRGMDQHMGSIQYATHTP